MNETRTEFSLVHRLDTGHRPIMTVAESLDRFGTVTLGIEYMSSTIGRSRSDGQIDASAWFAVVPKCYRGRVVACIEAVFERHRGRKLTEESVAGLVADINREIGARVERVEPTSDCNCDAIREAMGEARPEHKIGGHEPDCVGTNELGHLLRVTPIR